jgi:inhibitor of KinA
MNKWPRFLCTGDLGLLVEFGDKIDLEIHQKIRKFFIVLGKTPLKGVVEVVPAYRSILVIYDPLKTSMERLQKEILNIEGKIEEVVVPPPETIEIPVLYGGEYGPELDAVAQHNGLTPQEVIEIHTSGTYLVYTLGPSGFPMLGGLSRRIFTPRLKTPRTLVPAGSVGIANDQTGVYTVDSPGGWQLIGRTPIRLFDPNKEDPFLIKMGNLIKFKGVTAAEYKEML